MQAVRAPSAPTMASPSSSPKDKNEATITLDIRQNIAAGALQRDAPRRHESPDDTDAKSKSKKEFIVMAFAEPFVVKVLPVSLGRLTASPSGPVKPGHSTTLMVRVERQFDFTGEFPVKIHFPDKSGLSAEPGRSPRGRTKRRSR